jgi:DNA-binding CsgD family transcriptional regulator
MNVARAVQEFATALDGAMTPEELKRVIAGLIAPFGATAHAMGEYGNAYLGADPLFLLAWPPGWAESWRDLLHFSLDPVVINAVFAGHPFTWSEIRPRMRGPAADHIDKAREFGLNEAYIIPILRLRTLPGSFAMAGPKLDMTTDEKRLLEQCALLAYQKLESLKGRPGPSLRTRILSYREREVLHWIAAGKSIPAVAEILNVSGHTARDYVKSAMRKLNATTQAQAVAIGVRLGEILP